MQPIIARVLSHFKGEVHNWPRNAAVYFSGASSLDREMALGTLPARSYESLELHPL